MPRGFSEGEWPWKMKSLPDVGRVNIKEKEIKRHERKGKMRAQRTKEYRRQFALKEMHSYSVVCFTV